MTQEKRVELYQKRDDNAESIFTGEPLIGDDLDEWTENRNDSRGKLRNA